MVDPTEPEPEPEPVSDSAGQVQEPSTSPIPLAAVAAQLAASGGAPGATAGPQPWQTTPTPPRPPRPPHEPARWPIAVALLNLTGLALGYAYLRRWVRFAVYLALTAGLVATAFAMDAAERPWQWRAAGVVWLAWMALDGWWLARSNLAGATVPKLRPGLVAAAAVIAVVVAYGAYWVAGGRAFQDAQDAQAKGDCTAAIAGYDNVTGPFELTLRDDLAAADTNREECEEFLRAAAHQDRGDFANAIVRYRDFAMDHPDSALMGFLDDRLRTSLLEYARQLRDAEEYTQATVAYRDLLKSGPDTELAAVARTELAENYLREATAYRAKLDPKGGSAALGPLRVVMDAYLAVQTEFADTPSAASVPAALVETFSEASRPFTDGRFCEALPVLDYFAKLPAAGTVGVIDTVHAHRAQANYECGVVKYGAKEFGEAVEHFELVTTDYAGHAAAPAALAGLIVARISRASPETIPTMPPPVGGDSPGPNRFTFYNDSPFEMEVLVAGPTAHRFVIPACSDCKADYPTAAEACVDLETKPSHTLRLNPGKYHVASRYLDEVLGPFDVQVVDVLANYWHTNCSYSGPS